MKTELELRLEELEKAMAKAPVGSDQYNYIARDYTMLKKAYLEEKETKLKEETKRAELALEETRVENEHEEAMKKVEVEKKSKGWVRILVEGAVTILIPQCVYMAWESSGRIWSGQAPKLFGKRFKK